MNVDLEPIFDQVQTGDPVGAAYRLAQLLAGAPGRAFYEAGSLALARRDELGEGALRFARIVFAEAVERDPDFADAHHDLASTMRELGMSQDAIPHYRRALEILPGDVDSLIGLGAAQCDAGFVDEGIGTLKRATEEHPDNGHAFANLGVALESAGRDELAAGAYAKAVARFDAVLLEAGDDESASEAALRLRWARIQHAHLLERLQRWPQAVVEFRHLYEEERTLAEAEAEAEAHAHDDDDDEDDENGDERHEDGAASSHGEVLDDGHRVEPGEPEGLFARAVVVPIERDDAASSGGPARTAAEGQPAGAADEGEKADGDDEGDEDDGDEDDVDENDEDDDEGDEDDDDEDDHEGLDLPEDAGRLGLERLFARLIQLRRFDLAYVVHCLLYTSPSPRDWLQSRLAGGGW